MWSDLVHAVGWAGHFGSVGERLWSGVASAAVPVVRLAGDLALPGDVPVPQPGCSK